MAIAFGHQYLKQAPAIAEPLAWRRRPAPLDQRVSLAPPLTADERGVGPTPLRHSTHLHTSPPCRREAGVLSGTATSPAQSERAIDEVLPVRAVGCEVRELMLRLARENPSCGYLRIARRASS